MTTTDVRELTTEAEFSAAFPVMVQLRTHLDEETYLEYVREMAEDGYRLFARTADGEVVALAGLEVRTTMYYGRHVWVHELVTDADHRSAGHGLALLDFVEDWARERGCELIALSSGLQREDAHRFYEDRAGMDRVSYVYTRSLTDS